MREIKFRVWNPATKKVVYDANEINLGSNVVAEIEHGSLKAEYMCENESWESAEIMQYTGIEDTNGKPIYEGDIVAYQWNGMERETHAVQSIFWAWQEYLNGKLPTIAKVIGNVHENPELVP